MILIALAILLAIAGALIRSAIKVDNDYVDHRKAGTILMVSGLLIGLLGAAFIALHMAFASDLGRHGIYHDRMPNGPVIMQRGVPAQ